MKEAVKFFPEIHLSLQLSLSVNMVLEMNLLHNPLTLKYKRPFSEEVKQSDFDILAHRGGGRNSDYLGVSENSIEMINIAERFGTTGVEIDARLSKDGVPFIISRW